MINWETLKHRIQQRNNKRGLPNIEAEYANKLAHISKEYEQTPSQ